MPREPAYGDERSQDGEALSPSEKAEAWRAEANVRRRGLGSPEPRPIPGRNHQLADARPAAYHTVLPPLTAIVCPVTKDASSLARYVAAQPTSSGLPQRPIGTVAR